MADPLLVLHGEALVGQLYDHDGRLELEYTASWLADERAFPLSASLPLEPGRITERRAHAFFANLLPEGQLREAVARRLGISPSNDAGLLAAIGGECAGALTIVPESAASDASPTYEPLPPEAIAAMARRFSVLPEVTSGRGLRLSLAGAQDKLPVRRDDDGRLWLPVNGAPSTHVLKIPSRDFKHLPANEVLVTRLAHSLELTAVDAELLNLDGVELALVRRYDRIVDGERTARLHQEDLCQALGLMPGTKYEAEGGPSFAAAMELVRTRSTEPLTDAGQLLRWLAFVLLAGNADGHGKNLSFVHRADPRLGVRLAPFYDLVCTGVYPRIDRRLAMSVGGERDPGQIAGRHWEALARAIDVGPRLVRREVEAMALSMPTAFDGVAEAHAAAHGPSPIIQRIRQVTRQRCRRCLELLG